MSVQYVSDLYIDLGERVHVRCIVRPKCEQELPFEIIRARYEMTNEKGLVENSGECEINGHEIDAMISPSAAGTYRLKYIYEIADETWVDNIRVKVG